MCHCRITCDKCMCNTSHHMDVDYSTPASYTFEKCEQFVVEVHEYWWATTNFGWNTNDLSVPSFTCFSQFDVYFFLKFLMVLSFRSGNPLRNVFWLSRCHFQLHTFQFLLSFHQNNEHTTVFFHAAFQLQG